MVSPKKHHTQAKMRGQFDTFPLRCPADERFRNGGEQPGSIATAAIGVNSATMSEARQGGQGALYDFTRTGAAELRNEPHAAGVMIGGEVVASLRHYPSCLA